MLCKPSVLKSEGNLHRQAKADEPSVARWWSPIILILVKHFGCRCVPVWFFGGDIWGMRQSNDVQPSRGDWAWQPGAHILGRFPSWDGTTHHLKAIKCEFSFSTAEQNNSRAASYFRSALNCVCLSIEFDSWRGSVRRYRIGTSACAHLVYRSVFLLTFLRHFQGHFVAVDGSSEETFFCNAIFESHEKTKPQPSVRSCMLSVFANSSRPSQETEATVRERVLFFRKSLMMIFFLRT